MITPTDIEEVAKELDDASNGREAFYRSSASRYYYAIYHILKKVQEESGSPLLKAQHGGMHEDLLYTLLNMKEVRFKQVAYAAREAKRLRVLADYNLNADFTADMSNKAAQVLRRISKFLSST